MRLKFSCKENTIVNLKQRKVVNIQIVETERNLELENYKLFWNTELLTLNMLKGN